MDIVQNFLTRRLSPSGVPAVQTWCLSSARSTIVEESATYVVSEPEGLFALGCYSRGKCKVYNKCTCLVSENARREFYATDYRIVSRFAACDAVSRRTSLCVVLSYC